MFEESAHCFSVLKCCWPCMLCVILHVKPCLRMLLPKSAEPFRLLSIVAALICDYTVAKLLCLMHGLMPAACN